MAWFRQSKGAIYRCKCLPLVPGPERHVANWKECLAPLDSSVCIAAPWWQPSFSKHSFTSFFSFCFSLPLKSATCPSSEPQMQILLGVRRPKVFSAPVLLTFSSCCHPIRDFALSDEPTVCEEHRNCSCRSQKQKAHSGCRPWNEGPLG